MGKDKSAGHKSDKKDKPSGTSGISKKDIKKEKKEKKNKLAKALTDPATGDVSEKLLKEIEKQSSEVVVKKEKKEKKDKDEKVKKEKKDKKDKKEKVEIDGEGDIEMDRADIVVPVVKAKKQEDDESADVKIKIVEGGDILVPFAKPLANEKVTKKALKTIKKGAKSKALKRGVKEVVKSIRKSPTTGSTSAPHGIVILAADISPMDVISHIPVLCEDHNIPYVFVHSRAELGLAAGTKRPTSVVMIVPSLLQLKKKGKEARTKDEVKVDEDALKEAYDELVNAVKVL